MSSVSNPQWVIVSYHSVETKTGLIDHALVLPCGWDTWLASTIRRWCLIRVNWCHHSPKCDQLKTLWSPEDKPLSKEETRRPANLEPPTAVRSRWVWYIHCLSNSSSLILIADAIDIALCFHILIASCKGITSCAAEWASSRLDTWHPTGNSLGEV